VNLSNVFLVQLIIIFIIINNLVVTFMQGIYNYIPETNHVSMVYSVGAVLYLQLVLHVMLFRMLNMFGTFTYYHYYYCFIIIINIDVIIIIIIIINNVINSQLMVFISVVYCIWCNQLELIYKRHFARVSTECYLSFSNVRCWHYLNPKQRCTDRESVLFKKKWSSNAQLTHNGHQHEKRGIKNSQHPPFTKSELRSCYAGSCCSVPTL
jgi:hypothetical protein